MNDIATDLENALTAIQAAQASVASQAPSTGDQVLEAITPVLTAAGWTAPAELPADTVPAEVTAQ